MAKQIISEEFKRMQKLAGIITEEQSNENFAATYTARGGFKTKYGSSNPSSDPKEKEKEENDIIKKAIEAVVSFFNDVEKDQEFKSQVDKLKADFDTEWNSNKARYEPTGKWNPTRQEGIKRKWNRQIEELFLNKLKTNSEIKNLSPSEAYQAARNLILSIATNNESDWYGAGPSKEKMLKAFEDSKTSSSKDSKTSSSSLFGKIKGLFNKKDIKEQLNKEELIQYVINEMSVKFRNQK